jgi:hypothetical protein
VAAQLLMTPRLSPAKLRLAPQLLATRMMRATCVWKGASGANQLESPMLARWLLVRGKFRLAPEMLMTIRLREAELQLELSMLARLLSLREKFQLSPELIGEVYCNDLRVLYSHFHTSECMMSKAKMSISLPSNSHRLNLENSLRRSMKSSRDSNCCSSAHLGTHKP